MPKIFGKVFTLFFPEIFGKVFTLFFPEIFVLPCFFAQDF